MLVTVINRGWREFRGWELICNRKRKGKGRESSSQEIGIFSWKLFSLYSSLVHDSLGVYSQISLNKIGVSIKKPQVP